MSQESDPNGGRGPRPADLFDSLARSARGDAAEPDEDAADELDLVEALRSTEEEPPDEAPVDASADAEASDAPAEDAEAPEEPPDLTLIGYVERHDRPPAFTGEDDQPYTVDVDVEPTDDPDAPFAAFFVFIRWAATGAGIMGHVESGDVAHGATEYEARLAALELSLYDVKDELDKAIRRRRKALEE